MKLKTSCVHTITVLPILKYSITKFVKPPLAGVKSEYVNGCNEDTFKQTWSIVSGVEGRKLAKMVVYGDGQLESFSNVNH